MPKIWNDLLNLFFPNLCRLCKKPLIDGEDQLCLFCLYNLPYTRFVAEDANPIIDLLADRERLKYASSFLYYQKDGPVQKLIHSLKYYDNKELAYLLGRLAARELLTANSRLCKVDCIMPVPLHPRKKRKRGYNQSEWIAKGIHSVLNIPIDTSSLIRTYQTETQTRKTIYNRWLNVKDIFALAVEPSVLEGKHILIIDDVITTGSTIGACVDALSVVENVEISLFSLSVVRKD